MRYVLSLCVLCASIFAAGQLSAADTADNAATYTTEGTFIWSVQKDKNTSVKAVFTKTASKDKYDVKFYFKWGKDHVYSGTAEGNLKDGVLRGTVKADDQDRTFTFDGSCKAAVFTGKHTETTKGETSTGTITWKPKA